MVKKNTRKSNKPPDDETKSERFIRVVTPRVNNAVKAIAVIGYCAGTPYEYTATQVSEIVKALDNAFQAVLKQFRKESKSEGGFTFKG